MYTCMEGCGSSGDSVPTNRPAALEPTVYPPVRRLTTFAWVVSANTRAPFASLLNTFDATVSYPVFSRFQIEHVAHILFISHRTLGRRRRSHSSAAAAVAGVAAAAAAAAATATATDSVSPALDSGTSPDGMPAAVSEAGTASAEGATGEALTPPADKSESRAEPRSNSPGRRSYSYRLRRGPKDGAEGDGGGNRPAGVHLRQHGRGGSKEKGWRSMHMVQCLRFHEVRLAVHRRSCLQDPQPHRA